ncbi:MAG: choice-of-anchor L domain-containing protein [Polyangiaceae bacterium]
MRAKASFLGLVCVASVGACSSGGPPSGFASSSSSGSSGGSTSSGSSGSGTPEGDGSVGMFGSSSGGSGSGGPSSTCNVTDQNVDMDMDGWTPAQGDCNDCDPNVNPGAIDVWHEPADGGAGYWGDEDCSGNPGDNAMPCDTGLALDDVTAGDGAKAIELCATATTSDRKYGVLSASYVRANGTAVTTPGNQVGIEGAWGTNVKVQGGANMLVLSSGYARTIGQPNACNGISCVTNATGTPPTGFPEDDAACPPTPAIADDIALELQIRAPTNATGYSFNFKFYSFEYPNYVCDTQGYNDQFVALVNPAPTGAYVPSGSSFGNISFDSNHNPVSVNIGYFDVCDPTTPTRFAQSCKSSGGTCPALPSPYCPLGVGDLAGTGFDTWSTDGPAGATRWLKTQAPVTPGSTITIRFAMWDAGNALYDSTVLVDDFQWIATGGTVGVGTTPAQ